METIAYQYYTYKLSVKELIAILQEHSDIVEDILEELVILGLTAGQINRIKELIDIL